MFVNGCICFWDNFTLRDDFSPLKVNQRGHFDKHCCNDSRVHLFVHVKRQKKYTHNKKSSKRFGGRVGRGVIMVLWVRSDSKSICPPWEVPDNPSLVIFVCGNSCAANGVMIRWDGILGGYGGSLHSQWIYLFLRKFHLARWLFASRAEPTSSLDKKCFNHPRVHLFVKRWKVISRVRNECV